MVTDDKAIKLTDGNSDKYFPTGLILEYKDNVKSFDNIQCKNLNDDNYSYEDKYGSFWLYNKKKGVFDPESEIPDDAETTFENHIHIMDNYNEKWKQKKYTTDLKYIEACKYSKFNNISSSIPNNCKNYVPWKCEKPNSKIIDSYYKKSCENIDDIQLKMLGLTKEVTPGAATTTTGQPGAATTTTGQPGVTTSTGQPGAATTSNNTNLFTLLSKLKFIVYN